MEISNLTKGILFSLIFLFWAASALTAYALALFSINTTIIFIVLSASVVCLILAFSLASKQKIVLAFIIALVPAPATIGFAMALPYIARVFA